MLFETLGQAVTNAQEQLVDYKGVLETPEGLEENYAFGGIPYGTHKRFDAPLKSYKGKNTRKWFHVNITRMDSGRYEVVTYPL